MVLFLGSLTLALGAAALLLYEAAPREACYMAGIFVLAACLWVTEAVPLFATAVLVVGLQIVLLANPGGWPGLGFEHGGGHTFRDILAAALDPVIVLFFGGFVLARAAVKTGVDATMASLLYRPCAGRPATVLLATLVLTAVFSMWMSNTATAAMMVALVMPAVAGMPAGEPFRKALVLAVAFAANIGGMGTPIGSPPNAVAMGYLREAGYPLSFLGWTALAVPLMCGLLAVAWALLWLLFRPRSASLVLQTAGRPMTPGGWYALAVFAVTVSLWLTEPWHGLPAAVVALLPVAAFTLTGLIGRDDVNSLDWSILILIAGGISLGAGARMTGLDQTVIGWLGVDDSLRAAVPILAILVCSTLVLSTFMSNTAAANLLLPMGISLAGAVAPSNGPVTIQFAIAIALTASVSMALPVSTPPNAIAYASGELRTREMLLAGGLIGLIAATLVVMASVRVLRAWGAG